MAKFRYAKAAVNYFIFGHREDNEIHQAIRGAYGPRLANYPELSAFMLQYEFSWKENLRDINEFVKNVRLTNGEPLCNYY